MTEEVWKPIKGYEGIYEVSSLGRFKSLERDVASTFYGRPRTLHLKEKILKQQQNHRGYMTIRIGTGANKVSLYMHRVVAEAFIPNPHNLPAINHKNEQPNDNRVENLEWCDHAYNNAYGNHGYKIAQARGYPVRQMTKDGQTVAEYYSANEAARRTGISVDGIYRCCLKRKRYKTAGGYRWEYIDKE
jgi:hypothetical protein